MTLTSQNWTSSLISCLRRDRSSCPTIMLCCPLISWRIRSSANFTLPLLILLMSVEFSGNLYRGLFSMAGSNLIHLERWKLMIILSQGIRTWSMLGCSKGKPRSWHRQEQEKLEQSIPRCKYRLMSIEKLEGVVMSKRADISTKKCQRMGRPSRMLHLKFCWINGSGRRKRIISIG